MEEYILKEDSKNLKEYNERVKNLDDGEDYIYHFDVLPQPFFGKVNNAKILLLAKNPSYSEFEDEYDTFLYKRQHKEININNYNDLYYETLKDVDFFENFDADCNKFFFNAWKWWRKNVIGNKVCMKEKYSSKDVAVLNLCGYHSKRYYDVNYNNYSKEYIKSIDFSKFELVIIVWGKDLWLPLLEGKVNKERIVFLNEYKDEFNNIRYGQNIIPIAKLLENEEKTVLKEFFYLKKK